MRSIDKNENGWQLFKKSEATLSIVRASQVYFELNACRSFRQRKKAELLRQVEAEFVAYLHKERRGFHVSNRLSVNIGIIYKHASYFSQNSALPPQALLSVEIVSLTPASACPRTGKFIHPCQLHPQASREAKTLQGYDTPT